MSFRLGELWSEAEAEEADTSVTVDLYSTWLEEPAVQPSAAGGEEAAVRCGVQWVRCYRAGTSATCAWMSLIWR